MINSALKLLIKRSCVKFDDGGIDRLLRDPRRAHKQPEPESC